MLFSQKTKRTTHSHRESPRREEEKEERELPGQRGLDMKRKNFLREISLVSLTKREGNNKDP